MYSATKNYTDRNGSRTVIGGVLYLGSDAQMKAEPGAKFEGLPQAAYMADNGSDVSTVAALRLRVNQLLAELKLAGLMAADAPAITVSAQPADLDLVAGAIDAGDTVTAGFAVSDGSTPSLQWYHSATKTNAGGTLIDGATGDTYAIPAGTAAGTYYYYCVATREGVTTASAVATVTVTAA